VFQAEFSPKATRGVFVCAQLSTLNFGIFLAYWIDYGFSFIENGSYAWRVPVILQCIFIIPIVALPTLLPETPRWLAAHNRPDEALEVLMNLNHGKMTTEEIEHTHRDILKAVSVESSIGSGTWSDLMRNDGKSQTALKTWHDCLPHR
jgi:MFS family permease